MAEIHPASSYCCSTYKYGRHQLNSKILYCYQLSSICTFNYINFVRVVHSKSVILNSENFHSGKLNLVELKMYEVY